MLMAARRAAAASPLKWSRTEASGAKSERKVLRRPADRKFAPQAILINIRRSSARESSDGGLPRRPEHGLSNPSDRDEGKQCAQARARSHHPIGRADHQNAEEYDRPSP